jgi:hypothetical protein
VHRTRKRSALGGSRRRASTAAPTMLHSGARGRRVFNDGDRETHIRPSALLTDPSAMPWNRSRPARSSVDDTESSI